MTQQEQYDEMCRVYKLYQEGKLIPVTYCIECEYYKPNKFVPDSERFICTKHLIYPEFCDYCSKGIKEK